LFLRQPSCQLAPSYDRGLTMRAAPCSWEASQPSEALLESVAASTAAGLSLPTVKRYETARGAKVSEDTVAKMVSALKAAVVVFVDRNGRGSGGRLKKRYPWSSLDRLDGRRCWLHWQSCMQDAPRYRSMQFGAWQGPARIWGDHGHADSGRSGLHDAGSEAVAAVLKK
jgi:hypothetical protein